MVVKSLGVAEAGYVEAGNTGIPKSRYKRPELFPSTYPPAEADQFSVLRL